LSPYSFVAAKPVYFAPQTPEIDGLVIDDWNGDARTALLAMIEVELLQEIDIRSRGGLHRVEPL
jgi:hypothetical protein